jgi:transposase
LTGEHVGQPLSGESHLRGADALRPAEGNTSGIANARGRFLATIDRNTPAHLDLHLIADNYQTHKHPKVQSWLKRHPRFHMHFTPTSASWINMVERLFAELTNKRLRRGIFHSIVELQAAIKRYINDRNRDPKPFIWTKTADTIIRIHDRVRGNLLSRAGH